MTFDYARFERSMQCTWVGKSFELFEKVDSTNSFLKGLAANGAAPHGMVAFTDFQSAGRGRLGRKWVAPAGSSLLVSVLFRPKFPPAQATWLTMLAGLAAIDAVKATVGLDLALKWPNDLMCRSADGQWRKTGGILLEVELDDNNIAYAIIGMGLNVNIAESALPDAMTPATSLSIEAGREIDRETLLAAWLGALESGFDSAEANISPQPAWNKHLITLNQAVTVSGAVTLSGTAIGTDEWGRLLVMDDEGTLHTVTAGDVSLRAG